MALPPGIRADKFSTDTLFSAIVGDILLAQSDNFRLPYLVRGDIDGFFGLVVDNLVQLLVISGLLTGIYGMPAEIVFGIIFPGAAISLLFGNAFYHCLR